MSLSRRLLQLMIAMAASLAVAIGTAFFGLLIFIGLAIFHSGSTGNEATASMLRFLPLVHLVVGVIVGGSAAAIGGALFVPREEWGKPIGAGALLGGVIGLVFPGAGTVLLLVVRPVLAFAGSFLFKQ